MTKIECTGDPQNCQLCTIAGNIFAQFPSETDPGCVKQQHGDSGVWSRGFGRIGDSKRRIFRNGGDKPVVGLDIDGTLGDYHGHFLDFAEKYFGRPMPSKEELNPGHPLWIHMGIELREYRDAKLAYRQGGFKRWMPVFDGAAELTHKIREAGAEIWITTTRPYLRLDNIDPDTREWLGRNKIQYDAVLFGDEKYKELVTQVGRTRIVGVVDDLPDALTLAHNCEIYNLWMMDQPYNRHFAPRWVDRIDNLWDLKDYLLAEVESYQEGLGRTWDL